MSGFNFLDITEAVDFVGGDEEIYKEILKTFSDTYGRDALAKEMTVVVNSNTIEILKTSELREKAMKEFHKIKGAALAVGAKKLGNSAKDLEIFFKNENIQADEQTILTVESLKKQFTVCYDKTLKEIDEFYKNPGSLK